MTTDVKYESKILGAEKDEVFSGLFDAIIEAAEEPSETQLAVRENVKTDHIYHGEGVAKGLEHMEIELRVFLFDGKKMASIRVMEKVHVASFETPEERQAFAQAATWTVLSKMN